jgi:hypothetical protein
MYKLHVEHCESGYITKVDYHPTTDPEGNSDWEMFYTRLWCKFDVKPKSVGFFLSK